MIDPRVEKIRVALIKAAEDAEGVQQSLDTETNRRIDIFTNAVVNVFDILMGRDNVV